MNCFRKILLFLTLLTPFSLLAQERSVEIEQIIADIYEQLSEESEISIDFEMFFDDLLELAENPIQINRASKEQLDKLHFLSDYQIDNILYYNYRNNGMQTLYELQLVEGLDMTDIRMMLPFLTLGDATAAPKEKLNLNNIFKYGKNELHFRIDHTLEKREGYNYLPEDTEDAAEKNARKYVGDPFYNHLKYRFRYRDKIQFGVTAEKDAGEQFWGDHNKGYDFYSAFFEMKNVGRIKTLVLGDYRANFGQGLIMRTDFSMGKSSYVMQVSPRASGLKKFSSTAEYDIFRGAGATLRFGKLDVTAFYSGKRIDADTIDGKFTSIIKSGLHRTQNDLAKKNTVLQQVIGANINYSSLWFQLGATAYHTNFSHELQARPTTYNTLYFSGKDQTVASINYKARWQRLSFFGETAITDRLATATTNGLSFYPTSRVGLVALHRHFSKDYHVLFARTFSESARVNNETGFYIGTEILPFRYWKISAYADSYRFPWVKSQIESPSYGQDYLIQADYSPKRNVNMYWRLKHESSMRNYSDTITVTPTLTMQSKWQLRYQLNYSFGDFNFKNQIDANGFDNEVDKKTYGFSALQDVSYQFRKIPLNLNLRMQAFDARNFNNRIYVYERDVLYAFSIPMNYGLGSRYYLNLKYDASEKLAFWLKLMQTVYADDRESQGSGNEEIPGNRKTDIRFLMRWKF